MTFKIVSIALALGGVLALTACDMLNLSWWPQPHSSGAQAYWQRVEEGSALYMVGPKAQQQLEENIAGCAREIDELVELNALRKAAPPEAHSDYQHALNASGDLGSFDNPTHLGSKKIAHTDYQDFEGCMRSKGWERVKYVRYQVASKANDTYAETRQYRDTGLSGGAAAAWEQQQTAKAHSAYANLNQ